MLTLKSTVRSQKFIQDVTAAILIDDNLGKITTSYNLGDGIINIIGSLNLYNNMLQFIPVTDPGAANSTGNTVTPLTVSLNDLDDTYQAKLVKVLSADFTETGTFASSTNYTVSDGSGSGVFRTNYSDLNYIGEPIPETTGNITAVVLQYQTTMQLVARDLSDLDFPEQLTFYFRGPSWMDNNPNNPQIWGPFNSWATAAEMTYDAGLGWWHTTIEVADAGAEIEYQSRFCQGGATKYQKATGDFGNNATFTSTTGEIWIDASDNASFSWNGDDFYLAADKITESQPTDPEPTNHVTSFAASPYSATAIGTTWINSDASGYLVKGSTVGYADIVDPVDGTTETDATLVKNVGTGQSAIFSGLTAETTYYFKIFPYNGSGGSINYKTDGSVPEASATTDVPLYYYLDAEGVGETKTTYASGTVTLSNIDWDLTDALIGTTASDWKTGNRSVRFGGYETSSMTMIEDKSNGIGSIYFQYRRYGTDDQLDWKVEYSTNGGVDWTLIGSSFTAPDNDIVQSFNEAVNVSGNVRVRIVLATNDGNVSSKRLNLDNLLITDYNTVCFLADMSLAENFTMDTDVLYLSGSFFSSPWPEPGSTETAFCSRLGVSDNYLNISNYTAGTYEYKYFKNTGWGNGEWSGNPNRKVNFASGELVNDLYSYVPFTGDGAFSNVSNWNASAVPDNLNILIDGSANVDGAVSVQKMYISESGVLTIDATKSLTANSAITNNATTSGIIIESNTSGTGSLLHNTDNLDITIQRYITGDANTANAKYHTVSVPLTASSNPVSGLFTGSYLYQFDQATQAYVSNGTSTTTPLEVDEGYLVYYPGANITYSFAGKANNGAFATAVSYPGVGDNFNLVPNPYPSAIDWDAASGWTKTNMNSAIYIYNSGSSSSGSYVWASYVAGNGGVGTNGGTNHIPVGQAFFVQSNASSPVLSMNNEVRVHSSQSFYKNTTEQAEMLRLTAQANGKTDEIIVRYIAEATSSFDGAFDALKLMGSADRPNLYSITPDNTNLSINSIPYTTESYELPLGFESDTEGEVTISFEGMESFGDWVTIMFEDQLTGIFTDLRESSSYTFTHAAANSPERFVLHFMGVTGFEEQPANQKHFTCWSVNGSIYVMAPGEEKVVSAELYDLQGRLLRSSDGFPGNIIQFSGLAADAIVLVRLTTATAQYSQKVFIR